MFLYRGLAIDVTKEQIRRGLVRRWRRSEYVLENDGREIFSGSLDDVDDLWLRLMSWLAEREIVDGWVIAT